MGNDYTTIRRVIDGKILTLELLDRRLVEPDHLQRVEQEIRDAVVSGNQKNLILNFDRVEFLSSAMLGVLISINALVQERGGTMALCGLTKEVRKMFKVMKLNSRITICDDVEEAKEALR